MKNLVLFFIAFFSLFSCNSSKKINQVSSTCDNIKDAYFQHWIGGQEQTGSGTNIHITFSESINDKKLIRIYFQNKVAEPHIIDDFTIVALFSTKNPDLILENSPKDEYGNQAPIMVKNFPNLAENEAVLEYLINDKSVFCKISNLKEKELLAYPSARPRN